MSKFQVGDRIKALNNTSRFYARGDLGTITSVGKSDCVVQFDVPYYKKDGKWFIDHGNFTKIGDSKMNKYDELKGRIEALDDGWNKDADNLYNEIRNGEWSEITVRDRKHDGEIKVRRYTKFSKEYKKEFKFDSQCSKNRAFKKVLLWFLDNSAIKKDEKAEKIKALQAQMDELQAQIKEIS